MTERPSVNPLVPIAIASGVAALSCAFVLAFSTFADTAAESRFRAMCENALGETRAGARPETLAPSVVRSGRPDFPVLIPVESAGAPTSYFALLSVSIPARPAMPPLVFLVRVGLDGTILLCRPMDVRFPGSLYVPSRQADMFSVTVGKGSASAPLSRDIRFSARESLSAISGATLTFDTATDALAELSRFVKELRR